MGRAWNEALANLGNSVANIYDSWDKKKQRDIENQLAFEQSGNQRLLTQAQIDNYKADNARQAGLQQAAIDKQKLEAEQTAEERARVMPELARLQGVFREEPKHEIARAGGYEFGPKGAPSLDTFDTTKPRMVLEPQMEGLGINKPLNPRQLLMGSEVMTSDLPEAKNLVSQVDKLEAERATDEARKDNIDARKLEREQNQRAREDAAKDRADLQLNNRQADKYLVAKDRFETKLLASRGQLGKQNELIDRVDRDLVLIDGVLSGKQPMTAQKWSELNAGLMNVIGGSISQGSLEHLTSSSVAQDAMNKLQYLSNTPQNAVGPAFIKDVRESFKRMSDVTKIKRERRIDAMLEGYEDVLEPVYVEKLRKIGRSFTDEGGIDDVGEKTDPLGIR